MKGQKGHYVISDSEEWLDLTKLIPSLLESSKVSSNELIRNLAQILALYSKVLFIPWEVGSSTQKNQNTRSEFKHGIQTKGARWIFMHLYGLKKAILLFEK